MERSGQQMNSIETVENGILLKNVVVSENDLSTNNEKETWLNVCSDCDFFSNNMCLSCNCLIINLMTFKNSKCPIEKW